MGIFAFLTSFYITVDILAGSPHGPGPSTRTLLVASTWIFSLLVTASLLFGILAVLRAKEPYSERGRAFRWAGLALLSLGLQALYWRVTLYGLNH